MSVTAPFFRERSSTFAVGVPPTTRAGKRAGGKPSHDRRRQPEPPPGTANRERFGRLLIMVAYAETQDSENKGGDMYTLGAGPGPHASPRSFVWALSLVGLLGSNFHLLAQVPPACPNVCDQKYALCIAASCDASGKCGKCDKSDGSCGYCYLFEGKSCSYHAACGSVKPSGSTVYSTYSERLSLDFGFKVLNCASATSSTDCMDGQCTLTGKTVTLTSKGGKKVDSDGDLPVQDE